MAINYNSTLSNEMRDVGKLQISRDRIPNEFADKIVPVVDINPKHSRIINLSQSIVVTATGGSTTALSARTDVDQYITSVWLGVSKNAACDVATGSYLMSATINGQAKNLFSIPLMTLQASDIIQVLAFPIPVKIDRGTAVSVTALGFAAGSLSRVAGVNGFTVDNPNA